MIRSLASKLFEAAFNGLKLAEAAASEQAGAAASSDYVMLGFPVMKQSMLLWMSLRNQMWTPQHTRRS